jgi:serine/threonine protein kinase
LISKEKSPKLCDFGSVKKIYASSTSGMSNSTSAVTGGTFGFQGPEISEDDDSKTFDHRMNDIYAVGGVLIFLFSGRLPFQSLAESAGAMAEKKHNMKLLKAWESKSPYLPENDITLVKQYVMKQSNDKVAEKMIELISKCMSTDPASRPLINHALEH